MEEKLSFKDLIEKYDEQTKIFNQIIEEINVDELQKEIEVYKKDIERHKKEDSNLLSRIGELNSELEKIENIGLQYDIGSAKADCENKILEIEQLREKNNSKIESLQREIEANEYNIARFNSKDDEKKKLDDEIIKEAEDRTEAANDVLFKKIEELNERKDKYGVLGNEQKQYTKEEKIVVDKIEEEIDSINKQIDKNKIMLKFFKDNLGKHKVRTVSQQAPTSPATTPATTAPTSPATTPVTTAPTRPATTPATTAPTRPATTPGIKPKINYIGINPKNHQIEIRVENNPVIKGKITQNYKDENEQVKQILEEVKDKLDEECNLDKNSKKLDPNILVILKQSKNDDMLYKYINAVCSKGKSELPFELKYDLEGSSFLDKEQRKNVKKIAKRAKKLGATVEKEKISNKIKAMLKTDKQLLLEDKYDRYLEEKRSRFTEKEIGYGLTKDGQKAMRKIDKTAEKLNGKREDEIKNPKPKHLKSRTNIISKNKTKAVSLGKETIGGLKIAATKLRGRLSKENKMATNMKVNNLREKYFHGSVDHTKAQQNANQQKSQNQQSQQQTR